MSSYSAVVLADSPLAYYRLGESVGSTATDSSGNARTGAYVNTPTLGATSLLTHDANSAVTLAAASSQEVTSANNAALNLANMVHEVVFSTTDPKVIIRDHTALNGWFFSLTGTNPVVRVSGTSYTFTGLTSASLLTGTRQHVVWGADATNIRLIVNGTEYTAVRGATTAAISPWHLGRNGTNSAVPADFLSGTVDEWAIYSSLSTTRAVEHYQALVVGLPATVRIDVSGTAFGGSPTWTDYSSSVMNDPGITITWGRQDQQGDPPPRTCEFELKNDTGVFTPGNAAAPAGWTRGARVNVREMVGASTYDRFDGYVDSVEPTWPGGVQSWSVVKVTCSDINARLGRQAPLHSMLEHEMLADSPTYLYALGEAQGSVSAGDMTGNYGPARRVDSYGTGALSFAENSELFDEATTGIKNAADFQAAGSPTSALAVPRVPSLAAAFSVEAWIVPPVSASPAQPGDFVSMTDAVGVYGGKYLAFRTSATSGRVLIDMSDTVNEATVFSTSGINLCDGKLHQALATLAADLKTLKLYIDGVLVGTNVAPAALAFGSVTTYNYMGAATGFSGKAQTPFPGVLSHVAFYPSELSAARVLAHYKAGVGTATEGSGARYARIAGYANVTTSGLPTGLATMGTQKTAGRNVLDVLTEVAATEGTVSYATGAGALTMQARNVRYSATAAVTLTADDIDPPSIRVDGQGVMNQITVSRPGGADQKYVNATAQTADGIADGGSFTVAPATDYDALQNAAWQVGTHLHPQTRIPSLKVDLLRQTNTAKVQSLLAADISTLVTLSGLPANAPATSVSLFIEGGAEVIAMDEWSIQFFTSPSLPFTTLRADASPSSRTKLDNGLKIPF